MVVGAPVQSVKEHKKVTDEIDDLYMTSIFATAELQSYLAGGSGGNRKEQVLSFYRSFYGLFVHTRYMSNVDAPSDKAGQPSLVEEIDGWFADAKTDMVRRKGYPDEFLDDGINLFAAYQKQLLLKGVVTISR
jgi:hypothetical protein